MASLHKKRMLALPSSCSCDKAFALYYTAVYSLTTSELLTSSWTSMFFHTKQADYVLQLTLFLLANPEPTINITFIYPKPLPQLRIFLPLLQCLYMCFISPSFLAKTQVATIFYTWHIPFNSILWPKHCIVNQSWDIGSFSHAWNLML